MGSTCCPREGGGKGTQPHHHHPTPHGTRRGARVGEVRGGSSSPLPPCVCIAMRSAKPPRPRRCVGCNPWGVPGSAEVRGAELAPCQAGEGSSSRPRSGSRSGPHARSFQLAWATPFCSPNHCAVARRAVSGGREAGVAQHAVMPTPSPPLGPLPRPPLSIGGLSKASQCGWVERGADSVRPPQGYHPSATPKGGGPRWGGASPGLKPSASVGPNGACRYGAGVAYPGGPPPEAV